VYYRNLEHLVYKLSGLVDPFRGQDIEEVCRLAAKGLAQTEIAARVGMTEDAVDSILDRYEGRKVPAMRPLRCGAQAKRAEEKRTQKRKELLKVAEKVTRLVEKGFTLVEISQIMKEPYHVLYHKLRRVGELFRDRYLRHSVVRARKKAKKAPILESD
jgi:transposase